MCGIAGFCGNKIAVPNENNIKNCIQTLRRRGPDSNGIKTKSYLNKKIIFIHTRLSIIDLSSNSNQPFEDDEGSLIFNGMIYNYIELRKKLISMGVKFRTSSDTEVLIKLLNIYKEKAFKMLDGMWSLAYYNFKSFQLILSRDRFGEKPLYYYKKKNNLFFSNSIKSLQRLSGLKLEFDKSKVNQQLNYSDKSIGINNKTIFNKIYQLDSGSYLKFDLKKNKIKKKKFWKLKISQKNISFKTATKKIVKLLDDIILTRVRSDVKNCLLISGGLDSNTIAYYAKKNSKIDGYSLISSNKYYDESDLIKLSGKKHNLKTNFVGSSNKDSLKTLKSIISNSYNILPTTSAMGFALLCKKIKEDKKRVILTGAGGDELFAGYYVNFLAHLLSLDKKKFHKNFKFWNLNVKKYIRNIRLKTFKGKNLKKNLKKLNFYIEGENLTKTYFKKNKLPEIKILSNDIFYNNMLQNYLLQNVPTQNHSYDLVSMHFSLEARSPFLSDSLAEYVYSLKKDYFMYNGEPKSLLRNAMKHRIVKNIIENYEKVGFYSPFSSFFNKYDFKKVKQYIINSKLIYNFIKKKNIKNLLNKNESQISHEESKLLFSCLNFAILEKELQNSF